MENVGIVLHLQHNTSTFSFLLFPWFGEVILWKIDSLRKEESSLILTPFAIRGGAKFTVRGYQGRPFIWYFLLLEHKTAYYRAFLAKLFSIFLLPLLPLISVSAIIA